MKIVRDIAAAALASLVLACGAAMSFLVNADGRVASVRVDHSSGQAAIDMAAYAVASGISFWPATRGGCRLPSLVAVPIAFRVVERGP